MSSKWFCKEYQWRWKQNNVWNPFSTGHTKTRPEPKPSRCIQSQVVRTQTLVGDIWRQTPIRTRLETNSFPERNSCLDVSGNKLPSRNINRPDASEDKHLLDASGDKHLPDTSGDKQRLDASGDKYCLDASTAKKCTWKFYVCKQHWFVGRDRLYARVLLTQWESCVRGFQVFSIESTQKENLFFYFFLFFFVCFFMADINVLCEAVWKMLTLYNHSLF